MSKNYRNLITILALIILGAGFCYIYFSTRPKTEEINTQKTPVLIVPSDILSDSVAQELSKFSQNGTLPITINPAEKGKDNPFANY